MPSAPPSQPVALRCVFSATLSGKHAVCEFAARPAAPGRGLLCRKPLARAACGELSALLLENARFVLAGRASGPGHKLRVHAGGLHGLQQTLGSGTTSPNVHEMLRAAQQRYGALAQLPFQTIVRAIAAWRR